MTRKSPKAASAAPRRLSAAARWRRSAALASCGGVALLGVAGAGYWYLQSGGLARLGDDALHLGASLGLAVTDIEVQGRQMTEPAAVLRAVGATRGTPILAVDPVEVKARLEALPWVRNASVERRLPNTLFIRLVERKPLALWQKNGKLHLIDRDGVVITSERLERFPGLLVIVGENAPKHAAEFLDMLATQPSLARRVVAGVRVGDRRWNLRMENGIDVELPESNPGEAWTKLAEIERKNGLLTRDIEAVDLRLPDRLVIRTVPEPAKETPKKGRAAAKNT